MNAMIKPERYLSLAECKALANTIPSEVVWVYDRYHDRAPDTTLMSFQEMISAMDIWVAQLPSYLPEDDRLFRLVHVNTFDTQEQLQCLKNEGKIFFAPLKE